MIATVLGSLLDVHRVWGYTVIVLNGLVGLFTLAAWRWRKLRGRQVWIAVIVGEAGMMIQVLLGTILVAGQHYKPPPLHMFYGFVSFITVGLLYSYRYVWKANDRMELAYGLGGLFLMGLGIRAVLQVVG